MHFVACTAPNGAVEPAPLSSLPFPAAVAFGATVRAFWAADDRYYLCETLRGTRDRWYRIDSAGAMAVSSSEPQVRVLPFPAPAHRETGTTTGRIVYRVIRGTLRRFAGDAAQGETAQGGTPRRGRTRILAVRAAASRRQPA